MYKAQTKARNSQTLATMHHLQRIALANIALLHPHQQHMDYDCVASGPQFSVRGLRCQQPSRAHALNLQPDSSVRLISGSADPPSDLWKVAWAFPTLERLRAPGSDSSDSSLAPHRYTARASGTFHNRTSGVQAPQRPRRVSRSPAPRVVGSLLRHPRCAGWVWSCRRCPLLAQPPRLCAPAPSSPSTTSTAARSSARDRFRALSRPLPRCPPRSAVQGLPQLLVERRGKRVPSREERVRTAHHPARQRPRPCACLTAPPCARACSAPRPAPKRPLPPSALFRRPPD